jgi:conserved oligomeric Golgi complex subunit 6
MGLLLQRSRIRYHTPRISARRIILNFLQLDEAKASLDLKSSTISELETQLEELKASLGSNTAALEAARENLENAELAKATAEKELMETREALDISRADGDKIQQVLDEVRMYL